MAGLKMANYFFGASFLTAHNPWFYLAGGPRLLKSAVMQKRSGALLLQDEQVFSREPPPRFQKISFTQEEKIF
jgi:hypothetical protein